MKASPRSSTELLLLAFLLLAAWPVPGVADGDAREKARAVLADRRFQTHLPDAPAERRRPPPQVKQAAPPGETEPVDGEIGGAGGIEPPPALPPPAPEGLKTLGRVAVWALACAGLGLAVLWLVNLFAARRAAPDVTTGADTAGKPEKPENTDPGDPAALAAQELYGEAAHALLLQAILILARRFRLAVPPSRTSRELLAALPLQGAAREAFAGLVATVERWWFGGAAVSAVEYRLCLDRYRLATGKTG